MRGVKHHLLDVVSPRKQFSVSDFVILAEKAIKEMSGSHFGSFRDKKIPIVCGGTGFYIDALLGDKQIQEVPPDLNCESN